MRSRSQDMLQARLGRDQVRDAYRRIAPVYDVWARLTESRARERCLALAAIRDGESVLEVAVGTGQAFARILQVNPHGYSVGIDLTDAMLARARDKALASGQDNFGLLIGDARALPLRAASCDVLVNNYMFDLLPEQEFAPVLGEFRRVLRPGGRLVLVNMAAEGPWYSRIWDWVYRVSPALLGGCRGVALSTYLQAAGFTVVRRDLLSQMSFPSEIILARCL